MLIMWKNKMIKQGFKHVDLIAKEMNDFFRQRWRGWNLKKTSKSLLLPPRKRPRRKGPIRRGNTMTPTPVL